MTATPMPDPLESLFGDHPPAMHGIGWIVEEYVGEDVDGEPVFETIPGEAAFTRIDVGTSILAAAAVAAVVGHYGGSASYLLSRDELLRAITVLEKATPDLDAPDRDALAVWQAMAEGADADGSGDGAPEAVYAFVGDREHRSGDPYVHRLIEVADSGRADVTYGESRFWPADGAPDDPYPLIAAWVRAWPGALPIAHELKELFEEQWVRFHSLPASKRYADTPEENATILRRHNTVLDELVGGDDGVVVIASQVASTPAPVIEPDFDDLFPAHTFWTAVPWHFADPSLSFAHLYVRRFAWRPGVLDEILEAVAGDQMSGVIIAPPDLRWLYHPYDGGADVILPTAGERNRLADAHDGWRSAHPSGL